jgi:magnesium transporter
MVKYYLTHDGRLTESIKPPQSLDDLIWVDMLFPSKEEERDVENLLSIETPTPEEMLEIEVSSRLYVENGAIFTTATLVTHFEKDSPESNSVTFIFKDKTLITLRYAEPKAFSLFLNRCTRNSEPLKSGVDIFVGLTEAIIDRLSDALEMIGRELDATSTKVFQKNTGPAASSSNLQDLLKKIGRNGDLNGKLRESLLSLSRLIGYLLLMGGKNKQEHIEDLETYAKDITALNEYTNYVSSRINLLLDATLGMINIEQNAIIKIFSVAAVVFLPPTLIASIYGMNFKNMPELDWFFGYPFAIFLMILFAILPYLFFKKKRWL